MKEEEKGEKRKKKQQTSPAQPNGLGPLAQHTARVNHTLKLSDPSLAQ